MRQLTTAPRGATCLVDNRLTLKSRTENPRSKAATQLTIKSEQRRQFNQRMKAMRSSAGLLFSRQITFIAKNNAT